MDPRIEGHPWSVRAARVLDLLGANTIDDLARLQERKILSMPNVGRSTLNEIKRFLEDNGRVLGEPLKRASRVASAWRGAGNCIEQDSLFMVFDDGSVVAWNNHRDPEVLLRADQIEQAFKKADEAGRRA